MAASVADIKDPVLTTGVRGPGGFPTPVTEPRRRDGLALASRNRLNVLAGLS